MKRPPSSDNPQRRTDAHPVHPMKGKASRKESLDRALSATVLVLNAVKEGAPQIGRVAGVALVVLSAVQVRAFQHQYFCCTHQYYSPILHLQAMRNNSQAFDRLIKDVIELTNVLITYFGPGDGEMKGGTADIPQDFADLLGYVSLCMQTNRD